MWQLCYSDAVIGLLRDSAKSFYLVSVTPDNPGRLLTEVADWQNICDMTLQLARSMPLSYLPSRYQQAHRVFNVCWRQKSSVELNTLDCLVVLPCTSPETPQCHAFSCETRPRPAFLACGCAAVETSVLFHFLLLDRPAECQATLLIVIDAEYPYQRFHHGG